MEEDLNEEELEERFYSMLHHVDDTKTDVTPSENALNVIKNAPHSTVRRYWRTSGQRPAPPLTNTTFQKVNNPKELPKQVTDDTKPKQEKCPSPNEPLPKHLSIFHTTSPHNVKKTIEILENEDDRAVEIMSSDDDEVIEVALPPKPTITIDSSDDEIAAHETPTKTKAVPEKETQREISASPVASIVSSVSDDFIRGDCVAFNISRRPENNSFDFSLHEADLDVGAPPKKKKKKKNKENAKTATSTPISATTTPSKPIGLDECFATPKSKAKNKKSKTKLYKVTETSIPSADVYDSDSNQSTIDVHSKTQNCNVVIEQALPSTDIFESDIVADTRSTNKSKSIHCNVDSSNSSTLLPKDNVSLNNTRQEVSQQKEYVIDLTENAHSNVNIEENIVMANVTGFTESDDYHDQSLNSFSLNDSRLGSTKVPNILLQNTDFHNLKGTDGPSRKRRYSMTTLRNDMQRFYNDSWGGEDFNHREIQKSMSRDKSLWLIDMKDKVPMYKKKNCVICNYCHRPGHRDDMCWHKPPVCHMCGLSGHREPRCPNKICVNCGSPNAAFSTVCGVCAGWGRCVCAHCRQRGHPASHCAAVWRRFHHTIYDPTVPPPPMQNISHAVTGQDHPIPAAGGKRLAYPQTHDTQASKGRNLSLDNTQRYSNAPIRQDLSIPARNESFDDRNRQSNDNRNESVSTQKSESSFNKNRNLSAAENTQTSKTPIRQEQTQPSAHDGPLDRKVEKCLEGNTADIIETPYEILLCKKRNISATDYTQPVQKNSKSPATQKCSKSVNDSPINTNVEPYERQVEIDSVRPDEMSFEVPFSKKRKTSATDYTQHTQRNSKTPVRQEQRIRARSEDPSEDKNAKRTEVDINHVTESRVDPETVISTEKASDFIPIPNNHDAQGYVIQDNNVTASNTADDCDTTAEDCSEHIPASHDIPRNKNKALRKLSKALESLNQNFGEPNALHKELNYLQNKHKQLLNQKQISPQKLQNNRGNIKDIAQKLNLVLLGQAGLSGGSTHVQELNLLKDKLVNLRQKTIPNNMRATIGEHYHSVFSNMPRDDYWELLNTYNKRLKKPSWGTKMKVEMKAKRKMQNQQQDKNFNKEVTNEEKVSGEVKAPQGVSKPKKEGLAKKDLSKLMVCWRKLLASGGKGNSKCAILARRLHAHISSLSKNSNTSAKNLKKIRKIEAQAQSFFNNARQSR